MAKNKRALVIGGSIGGLCAGHLLHRAGWDVTVYERSRSDLADRGAGLGVSKELFDIMARIGIAPDPSLSVAAATSIWLGQHDEVVRELPRASRGSTWPVIYQPLRRALPDTLYRPGMMLTRIEQEGARPRAIFADGTMEEADLIVAADGVMSTVRRQFLPAVAPKLAGYVAWRGLIDEREVPAAARELFFDRIVFAFPEGESILSVHVPGPGNDVRPGHRRYYFIWYRPATPEHQRDMFTDAAGQDHGLSIPPALIRREFIDEMHAAARAKLSPLMAEIVGLVQQPLLQAITDMESPQLVFGRVALMGDAAFVARPHVAAGTSKAALDAVCLVDALDAAGGDIDAALARYNEQRCAFGRAIVAHSRYLGAYIEAQTRPPAERGAAATRDPARIITDYGAPHLVHPAEG
ncbi:MAG TPA: FAD-dependent monooxygenase [Stellaceae bacterium]|nr:FAD-dependent monooxygenase [Stellaceae bacterium]